MLKGAVSTLQQPREQGPLAERWKTAYKLFNKRSEMGIGTSFFLSIDKAFLIKIRLYCQTKTSR